MILVVMVQKVKELGPKGAQTAFIQFQDNQLCISFSIVLKLYHKQKVGIYFKGLLGKLSRIKVNKGAKNMHFSNFHKITCVYLCTLYHKVPYNTGKAGIQFGINFPKYVGIRGQKEAFFQFTGNMMCLRVLQISINFYQKVQYQ